MFFIKITCFFSCAAVAVTALRTVRQPLTVGYNSRNSRLLPLFAGKIDYEDFESIDGSRLNSSPPISWYPGHIAKAERELADYLKKVDVVIEVRDARIPLSTTHPMVPEWVGNRPLIVAIARIDQISKKALDAWREYYTLNPAHASRPDAKVYFIDGKLGAGVLTLKKQALKAGVSINERYGWSASFHLLSILQGKLSLLIFATIDSSNVSIHQYSQFFEYLIIPRTGEKREVFSLGP